MPTIVGIQFKGMGRIYYFDPLTTTFEKGDHVVVETVRGLELGLVIIGNREVDDSQIEYELKPIIRKATKKDLEDEKKNNEQAEKSFIIFKKYVNECNLEMKPLYCEYTLDHSKLIFYYCAEDADLWRRGGAFGAGGGLRPAADAAGCIGRGGADFRARRPRAHRRERAAHFGMEARARTDRGGIKHRARSSGT